MTDMFLSFGLGWFLWTFLEYALHGWLGHWRKGRARFTRQHLKHHATTDYFFPFVEKFIVFVPAISLIAPGAIALSGLQLGMLFTLGTVSGWLFQEVVHRRMHTHAPRNAYGRWARRHHLHHHFANPKTNHGLTTSLWDHVFRTYEKPGVITVPGKQVPRLSWILEVGESKVAAAFAGDYRIA